MHKKKLGYMLVALLLLVALLAACGGGDDTSTTPDGTPTSGGDGEEVVELTMFINHPWWPTREWSGELAEEITKKTGVRLNIQIAADDNQLPLMISSGDLPDLVYTADNIDRMSDSRISMAWNELIDQYAPDFEIDPISIAINTAEDGNFYTIKNAFSSEEEWMGNDKALPGGGTPGLALREDILEELGNPSLNSLDDFANVLGMVKENYPDMIPMVMDVNHIGSYLRTQHGIIGPWYEEAGELYHEIRQPAYLEYYKYMNMLYRNGYITAENFTFADDRQDDQLVLGGRAFAHMYVLRVADENNTNLQNQGEDFRFSLQKEPLSEDARYINSGTGWSGTFITNNNSNPEAAIKFVQFMMSEEGQQLGLWGIEDVHWTMHEEGYPEYLFDPSDSEFKDRLGIHWWGLFASGAVLEGVGNYVPGLQATEAAQKIKEDFQFYPELGLVQPLADTEERNIQNRIDDMITNEETKIYLANSEEEAIQAYNQMIENAERIGLEQLEEWASEEYQRVLENF